MDSSSIMPSESTTRHLAIRALRSFLCNSASNATAIWGLGSGRCNFLPGLFLCGCQTRPERDRRRLSFNGRFVLSVQASYFLEQGRFVLGFKTIRLKQL